MTFETTVKLRAQLRYLSVTYLQSGRKTKARQLDEYLISRTSNKSFKNNAFV